MFDGVRLNLGLSIVAVVIVLLPITFVVVRRWRKRSQEAELQRLSRQSSYRENVQTWINGPASEPGAESLSPTNEAAPSEMSLKGRGLFRRLSYAFVHPLDDRQSGGYSSVAPRRPDGSRTKIFFFNGNGHGR